MTFWLFQTINKEFLPRKISVFEVYNITIKLSTPDMMLNIKETKDFAKNKIEDILSMHVY